ncbi:MAG: sugar transferase [Thermoleophilia bacterium]
MGSQPATPRDTPGRLIRRDARFLPLLGGPAAGARLRRAVSVLVLVAMDITALFLGMYAAFALKLVLRHVPVSAQDIWSIEQRALPLAAVALVLTFANRRLYAPREQRAGAAAILSGVTVCALIMLALVLVAQWQFRTYYTFYASWFFVSVITIALRASYDSLTTLVLDRMRFRRDVVLVGPEQATESVAESLDHTSSRRGVPYRVVGRHRLTEDRTELERMFDGQRFDEVIVTGISGDDAGMLRLLEVCQRQGIPVRLAPTSVELLSHSLQAIAAPGLPLFALHPPMLSGLQFFFKRVFDLAMGTVLLVLVSPVLAVAALAIKLEDRGPILHRSRRVGVEETQFDCLKLRTMHVHAERMQADMEHLNEADGAIFKIKADPRVTRAGVLLRRYSIDELPQLINVLRGEMSLVGPRPLPVRDFELLDDVQKKRYMVLPGITGLWQVSGRSDLSFDELIRLDFSYIETWSIWSDLVILGRSIPVVLWRKGAY